MLDMKIPDNDFPYFLSLCPKSLPVFFFKVDIRKEDPSSSVIASARSSSGHLPFRNPVHLREDVTYIVTIHVLDPKTALYGSKFSSEVYEADGFKFNITPGVFIDYLEFF